MRRIPAGGPIPAAVPLVTTLAIIPRRTASYWSPERTDVMRCVLKPSQCIRPA